VRTVVANGADDGLRAHAAQLGGSVEWVIDRGEQWVDALGLRGRHNRTNALIAAACLAAAGLSVDGLDEAAAGFAALPSRLTTVAVVDGVEFVDDSLSTNVLPTVAALEVFGDRRVALLVGGFDRGIDYQPLADHIAARRAPLLAIGLPESGPRITALLADRTGAEVATSDDLATAVARAYRWAHPAGVVLLSPAAPSFGQFTDYRDRAQAFAAAVEALT
jgi:UDP-N-acetylmuramoylalanine--D-glutamate ligase